MTAPIPLAPVRPAAAATIALLVAAGGVNAFGTWSDWNRYWVVADYVDGVPGVGVSDLVSADNTSASAGWLMLLALAAAAAVFLTWLWRARNNAERLSRAEHRLGRGWTIGAWFCPIVNLWLPRQILDDIWSTSRPGVPTDQYRVHGLERSPLVRWWWWALIANWVVTLLVRLQLRGEVSVDLLQTVAVYSTVSMLLVIAAAVLLIRIVRQVTEWQSIPRHVDELRPQQA
jgi:hypothetical protein